MEFKQLQSFTTLVQYKSFTKAAEVLQISQPTISTHIRLLEEELNSRLILRTTKSVEITQRGWELYECACKILELRDDLISRWAGDEKKLLHLGVSTIPSAYIIPEILPEFGKHFPDNYFIIHQGDSQSVVSGMLEGEYDVGLVGMPVDQKDLECYPFFQDKMLVITPVNEHFLQYKDRKTFPVSAFLEEPIILREQGSGSKKSAERFFEKNGISEKDLNIAARINDQESIKNLVAEGMGISITSEKAAENFLQEKRLLGFELEGDTSARELYVIVRKGDLVKKNIKDFVTFVRHFYN